MTKKIISVLLCVLTIMSIFTVIPATSAGAVSYKDELIDAIVSNEDYWYDKKLFSKKGYYGYGSVEFIDFNFDGNLEFVIHLPSTEYRMAYNQVIQYKDGELISARGDEYGGYYGNDLKLTYGNTSGKFVFQGSSMFYENYNAWVQQNYSAFFRDDDYFQVQYYSGKLYVDGKTTYFGQSNSFMDLEDTYAVSYSKYEKINKDFSTNAKVSMSSKKIDLNKWYSYSSKNKKTLLSESYDAFKVSSNIVKAPPLPTYEARGDLISLKWKAVKGAANYRVYRKTSANGKWKSLGTTKTTKFVDRDVKAGKNYIYTIRCVNNTGKYPVSSYNKTGKTAINLKPPHLTKIGNAKDGVKVTWDKVDGASKYRVYVNEHGNWISIGDTSKNYFVDKNVESDKRYSYNVRCISSTGKTYQSDFDEYGIGIKFIATPVLSKLTAEENGVVVSWEPVKGARIYRVYVKGGEFKKWTKVGDTLNTSLVHLQPASGVKYTYTVACMIADLRERISSFDSKGLTINYIAAPVVTNAEVDSNGITLTWDKVDGAQKYRVFVKSGSKWKKLKDTTSLTFTHKDLTEGNSYTYTVRCISSTGKSYTSAYNKDGWTYDYVLEFPTEPETQLPTEIVAEYASENVSEVM